MTLAVLLALYIHILALDDVCHGQEYPFRNTSLTFEDRVKVHLFHAFWLQLWRS